MMSTPSLEIAMYKRGFVSVKELARRTGVPISTLRRYALIGKLPVRKERSHVFVEIAGALPVLGEAATSAWKESTPEIRPPNQRRKRKRKAA